MSDLTGFEFLPGCVLQGKRGNTRAFFMRWQPVFPQVHRVSLDTQGNFRHTEEGLYCSVKNTLAHVYILCLLFIF